MDNAPKTRPSSRHRTLLSLLSERAVTSPDFRLYTFLEDKQNAECSIDYAGLDTAARRIATALQAVADSGERIILLYPPGLEYISAFFGCLYGAMIAVPAYPPEPSRLERTLARLRTIVKDARATVVLTSSFIVSMKELLFAQAPDLGELRWIATDALPASSEEAWQRPDIGSDTVAFLQYTSGSTGTPRGVVLSHGNLLHNLSLSAHAFQLRRDSIGVFWLPPYHDMGLIGGILGPLYTGFTAVLMSPLTFLRRPYRWLHAISQFRATVSGGPNFAYDLCVRKIGPDEASTLDLSSWTLAFSGAEPIHPATLDRFTEQFGRHGFRRERFYPCYGLAEGTLIVSGGQPAEPPRIQVVDAKALEHHRVELVAPEQPAARAVVSCGRSLLDQRVVIAHPETLGRCPDGTVGEIWVMGASVALGYWQNPEETERVFGARLADTGAGPFLRTGDLGFLLGEELFVTGRLKDLVIIRGRNHYPQDIEQTVERCHPALRPGNAAVFSVEVASEERLVIVQEADPRAVTEPDQVVAAVRRTVAEAHELSLYALVLIAPGTIFKTSSGKIQRRACRAAYLAGGLQVLAAWTDDAATTRAEVMPEAATEQTTIAALSTVAAVERWLIDRLSAQLQVCRDEVERDAPITRYAIDSLSTVELAHDIERSLGVIIAMESLLSGPSITELARRIFTQRAVGPSATISSAMVGDEIPLALAQQRLWFLDQMQPGSPFYNLPVALRLEGPLDAGAIEQSLTEILRRHSALRTVFSTVEGKSVPSVLPAGPVALRFSDLSDRPEHARRAEASDLASELARQPFDLERGPLLRAELVRLAPQDHILVLVVHHIAADGWSMRVLSRELEACYRALSDGKPALLPALAIQYADFARWQRTWLSGTRLDEQIAYWRQRLAGAAPLELPSDHPRPPVQTYRGATHTVVLPGALATRLRALARTEDATLFMVVMAGFQALLHRYSGQHDVSVGTAVTGRDRVELEGLIGFFVNTLVLRVDLSGTPSFRALIRRVRQAALEAFAHQDVPFERLVEVLQPARDLSRSSLIQAMFVLRNAPALPRLDGITVSEVPVHSGAVAFDLQLNLTEEPHGLVGTFEYSTSLFEPSTIVRMAEHFQVLLESAVADPARPIGELAVSSHAERELLLTTWNATDARHPDRTIVELFEAKAAQRPSATAVVFERRELTYGELNARANRLARRLRASGIGPESLVGMYTDRSFEMMVGVLGILKVGAAYLPLDPEYPAQRIEYILEDARPPIVLAVEKLLDTLPRTDAQVWCLDRDWPEIACYSAEPVAGASYLGSLAYVIYTSGSTGRPKGVAIEHRSIAVLVAWAREVFDDDELSGVLASTSLCFDLSVFELFVPLCWGGSVILAQNALALPELADAARVRLVNTVPSAMAELVRTQPLPASVRTVNLCGEVLTGKLADRLHELRVGRVVNLYGPSEDTVYSTFTIVPVGSDQTPMIGRPVSHTQVYLLDAYLQPVPLGTVGEIHLGGMGLARGYLHRPDLTAERFIPDPFGKQPGGRLYRTGDLARYRVDGELEFLGRVDHQVKIRGFRIELGEIETALGSHEAIDQAVVLAREDRPGDRRLVAYFTQKTEQPLVGELRSWLRQRLPAVMVPSAFVRMTALPQTPNGKVDRKALPAPEGERAEIERAYIAPATRTEQRLAEVWSQFLGVQKVGRTDNFFELGGHSLLAMQVISRMRRAFGVKLPLRDLFETPVLADLAAKVNRACQDENAKQAPTLTRVEQAGRAPLSFAQQRIWLIDRLEPNSPLYNLAAALRLEGALDEPALARSLDQVVRRHEVLRTVFPDDAGDPVQVLLPVGELRIEKLDLRDLPPAHRAEAARRAAEDEARRPFDLANGPLLRVRLVTVADTEHVLVVVMHHIVSDGWSIGVMAREVSVLYDAFRLGRSSPLPDLLIQYPDYAVWQRELLAGGALDDQLAYWREQLEGAPRLLELPTDRARPPVQSHRGGRVPVAIPPHVTAALRALAHEQGATLFMALLAGFQTLMYRYSGQRDLCVGSPIAGRNHAEIEGLIGVFVNTLVLRTRLDGDATLRQLLDRVREVTLGAYANQDVPFERLVEELRPERSMSYAPLFQVMVALQQHAAVDLRLPGLKVTFEELNSDTAKFDLTLSMTETDAGLSGWLEYNLDIFDAETAARMAEHLRMLLEGAVASPDTPVARLPLLTEAERRRMLVEWNQTAAEYPRDATVHELFVEQAARRPVAVALEYGDERVTYAELDERANRLANHLVRRGVNPGMLVGLSLPRSVDMVVGVLGILKAGAAYVPLDAAYPVERLAFMIEDTGLSVIVTNDPLREILPIHGRKAVCVDSEREVIAQESAAPPPVTVPAESLAYVMYTSGSTGRPKGVCIPHRGVVRLVRGTNYMHMGTDVGFAMLAASAFDGSTFEMWGALLNGGRLAVFPDGTLSLEEIAKLLEKHRVSAMLLPVVLFEQMANHQPEALDRVKQLVVGGDVLPARPVKERLSRGAMMINAYGPTENTVITCCQVLTSPAQVVGTVSIGKPIQNTRVYVLDEWLQPVPVGVPGELHTGGDGLAWGYLRRPELTAERFITDPFASEPGARLYRTGDRVRWMANGTLEFLGRVDEQVKIRGFRIEPGEVEAALAAHEAVHEAAVMAREDDLGDKRLVAYFVPRNERALASELRTWLRQRLPEYMLPSAFVRMNALPMTPNGKVDRKALPAPTGAQVKLRGNRVELGDPPRSSVEESVARVFGEVLRADSVGLEDDFFDLGGHSLAAMKVIALLRERLDVDLELRALFEAPTVAGLARRAASAPARRIWSPREDSGSYPLSFAQQRLWFIERLGHAGAAYHLATAFHLQGPLVRDALESSLHALVRRHESIRVRVQDGQQVVCPAIFKLRCTDLSSIALDRRHQAAQESAHEEGLRPFDLEAEPPIRVSLLHLGPDEHVLCLVAHHLVADGLSVGLIFQELAAGYNAALAGVAPSLDPPRVRYADFVAWQQQWLSGETLAAQISHWMHALAGAPTVLDLSTDKPRPEVRSTHGAVVGFSLATASLERLCALARDEGATPFMALLAVFAAVLARHAGQDDLLIGTPVSGRPRPEFEQVVGMFADTLVLRVALEGRPSLRQLLRRVRATTLGALAHAELPFDRLVEEMKPPRDLSRSPLVQVMFSYEDGMAVLPELAELTATPWEIDLGTAQFDLTLRIDRHEHGARCALEYSTDLFEAATAERLASHVERLVTLAPSSPDAPVAELPLLDAHERAELLGLAAGAECDPTGGHVLELFWRHVARTPLAPAVVGSDEQLSYRALAERATRLAHHLRSIGVAHDRCVGVYLERGCAAVVALMAILEAGGAYVPLDLAWPAERVRFALQDARACCVVSRGPLLDAIGGVPCTAVQVDRDAAAIAARSAVRLEPGGHSEALAYVIYTSGSTGRPKGVGISRANLAASTAARRAYYGEPVRAYLLLSSLSFDSSVAGLFWTLADGGTLVLPPDEGWGDPAAIGTLLTRHDVSHLLAIPGLYQELLARVPEAALERLKVAIVAGEACPMALVSRHVAAVPTVKLYNEYGPTEATVWSTVHLCTDAASGTRVPIGRPIPGAAVYVLDDALEPVPRGAVGQLFVGGPGIARGYVGRPDLTAEHFVPDPHGAAGGRLYRTGDLARVCNDGVIEFLGRTDHQVKLRGLRIELGEIESRLQEIDGVKEAAVALCEFGPGDLRLVAYVVGAPESDDAIREHLRAHLPAGWMPTQWVRLAALPRNPNGKLNRRLLPAPQPGLRSLSDAYVAPRVGLERTIAEVWRDALKVERVGSRDNFFDLGGHSLLLFRVQQMLRERLARDVPIVDLFRYPTVERLAAALDVADSPPVSREDDPSVAARERGKTRVQHLAQRRRRDGQ